MRQQHGRLVQAGFLALLVALGLPENQELHAQGTLLRVGIYYNHPLIYLQDDRPQGLFADVLLQLAEHEDWTLQWVYGSWADSFAALQAGRLDILPVVAWDETRTAVIDYSVQPLLSNWAVIYSRKGLQIDSFLDLQDLHIAMLENDTHSTALTSLLEKFGVSYRLVSVATYADMTEALESGRVDVAVFNYVYATVNGINARFPQTSMFFNPIKIHFAVPKGDPAGILPALNAGIQQLRQNENTYQQLVGQYLGMNSPSKLPGWVPVAGAVALVALVMTMLFNLWLRKLVRQKTLELELANGALLKREAYLKSMFDSSPLAMLSLDMDGRVVRYNPTAEQLFGWSSNEALGNYPPFVTPDKISEFLMLLERMKQGEAFRGVEIERRTRSDNLIPLSLYSAPIIDSDGTMMGMIASLEDIRQRKKDQAVVLRTLEEKQILLREIHHRVKNNLTVISSLLNLQAQRISSPEQALAAFRQSSDRIMAMALVHMELYETGDFSRVNMKNYVAGLSQHLAHVFSQSQAVAISCSIEDIQLTMQKAIPCGLIINELVTNACKYAYPSGLAGPVRVGLTRQHDTHVLSVEDDGVGLPDDLAEVCPEGSSEGTAKAELSGLSQGLGMTLIRLLTEQIDGNLILSGSLRPDSKKPASGARIEIRFPV